MFFNQRIPHRHFLLLRLGVAIPPGTARRSPLRELFGFCFSMWLLDGGVPTPLKNIKVSWDDYSQYMGK